MISCSRGQLVIIRDAVLLIWNSQSRCPPDYGDVVFGVVMSVPNEGKLAIYMKYVPNLYGELVPSNRLDRHDVIVEGNLYSFFTQQIKNTLHLALLA